MLPAQHRQQLTWRRRHHGLLSTSGTNQYVCIIAINTITAQRTPVSSLLNEGCPILLPPAVAPTSRETVVRNRRRTANEAVLGDAETIGLISSP